MCKIQGDTAGSSKPPVDIKTKVPLWPGQARPGQNVTFVLKSAGGLELPAVSPCMLYSDYILGVSSAGGAEGVGGGGDLAVVVRHRPHLERRLSRELHPEK